MNYFLMVKLALSSLSLWSSRLLSSSELLLVSFCLYSGDKFIAQQCPFMISMIRKIENEVYQCQEYFYSKYCIVWDNTHLDLHDEYIETNNPFGKIFSEMVNSVWVIFLRSNNFLKFVIALLIARKNQSDLSYMGASTQLRPLFTSTFSRQVLSRLVL
jgi:hypothetical protein